MSLPESTPKLPKWFFLLSDLLLIAVAAFIAAYAPRPLTVPAILAITGCVALGALLTAAALIADYVRKTEEAIDDRQRALEALSRTVATSAEQISIATGGLNEIATLAQKNLQQADQLPGKLQEKFAGFTRQLDAVRTTETDKLQHEITALRAAATTERAALQQELAALRQVETDKLAAASAGISQATAELTKLEAATARHLAATTAALAAVPDSTTQALARQQEALQNARTTTEAALAAALANFESKLASLTRSLDEKLTAFQSTAAQVTVAPAPAAEVAPTPVPAPVAEEITLPPFDMTAPAPITEVEPAPAPVDTAIPVAPESTTDAPSPEPELKAPKKPRAPRKPKPVEPEGELSLAAESAPAPVETPAVPDVIAAEAPATAPDPEPTPTPEAIEAPAPAVAPEEPIPSPAPEPAAAEPVEETPAAVTTTDEFTQLSPDEVAPLESITSDSTTRLLVTAYIGIGNRLFIRGDGPGLSWDKGVPLQFVSIGKWRWETLDASSLIRAKLYKNDETECAALGELRLSPGHQSEVTARF